MSELANVLAFCKSLLEQLNCNANYSFTCPVELAASCLESYHLSNVMIEDESNSWLPLIQFIIEQLKLILVPEKGRRYSSAIILRSFCGN